MMFKARHMMAACWIALATVASAAELPHDASEDLLAKGEIIQSDIQIDGQSAAVFVLRSNGRIYACRTWVDVDKAAVRVSCWDSE